jgi:hypothetical protein
LVAISAAFGAPAGRTDREVFPGATLDCAETATLAREGPVVVYRTARPFGIVLNYYRFKRKQAVHVTVDDPAARFRNIAAALERAGPSAPVSREPLVRRFHLLRFGDAHVEPGSAVPAWREYARRYQGRMQQVGEGERVTIYRPYLSQRTFELVDETVIVLRTHGGSRNESATPTTAPGHPGSGVAEHPVGCTNH